MRPTIKIELVTPNGPRVTYDVLDQPEEIDAEAAKHGLRVDYSSQVKIGFGSTTYRSPLVALEDDRGEILKSQEAVDAIVRTIDPAEAEKIATGLTGPQGELLVGAVYYDLGYGGSAPVARRLHALGLVEEPTDIPPLVLVVTPMGYAVAEVIRGR